MLRRSFTGKIYSFFRSTYLGAFLIGYLIVYLISSSLFGLPATGSGVWWGMLSYVPIGLFFINLSVCTLSRIFAMLRVGSYRGRSGLLRAGPDLVHISLLLLSVAGIIGLLYREEGMVDLAPGETVRINQDYSITLKEFTARRYEDGSPRAWISRVDVRHGGEVIREDELILVNSPLKVDRVRIYQSSYKEADEGMRTVLTAVYDPSEPFVLVSLVLMAAGVIMAVLRKVLTTSW